MGDMVKVVSDVERHLSHCAQIMGRLETGVFHDQTREYFEAYNITYPIEQLLYCSLVTVQRLNFIPTAEIINLKDNTYSDGLYIQPQFEVGQYRSDFFLSYTRTRYYQNRSPHRQTVVKEVLVECDSQQWHERSESERRYEKERDRFLTKNGYTVFHYTGKEITDESYRVASEILAYLTEHEIEVRLR